MGKNYNSSRLVNGLSVTSNGSVGVGVTPSSWSGFNTLQVGALGLWSTSANNSHFSSNLYYDGTDRRYIATDYALEYNQQSGIHKWLYAASGTAGAIATLTEAMRINTSGQIAIGTTSAISGRKLTLTDSGGTYIAYANIGSGARTYTTGVDNYGYILYDDTAAAYRMVVNSSGNVGIGTNNPSLSKLQIVGDWDYNTTNNTQITIQGATNTNQMLRIGYSTTGDFGYIASLVSGTAYKPLAINPSGGNVGIGTISPSALLHVAGSAPYIHIQPTSGSRYIDIGNWDASTNFMEAGGGGLYIKTQQAYDLLFGTNAAERMRITSGGNVLIGTTSVPSAYGLVAIRGTNQGLTIQDAVSNGYRSLYFQSGNLYFYNGTNEGYLSSGGTWVNASDITLKKDVKDIEYGLDSVMQLKPKWYRMIEDDLEQIGFIAQDVEEVVPELVSTSEKGMKGLSYGQLTAVLVKAIQEQQAMIEAQQQQINQLINK